MGKSDQLHVPAALPARKELLIPTEYKVVKTGILLLPGIESQTVITLSTLGNKCTVFCMISGFRHEGDEKCAG
jgi:hypothetical protein